MSINTNLAYLHDDYEDFFEQRLTKKQRKAQRKKQNTGLRLRHIDPQTPNQIRTFEKYEDGNHLLLQGVAGTGKTFISSYLALDEILNHRSSKQKLVIVRSVVPTREMGFLPGNQKEKQRI